MAIRVEGVPETLPRSRWVEMVEALGLSPGDIHRFEATYKGIRAVVFARDESGKHFADGERMATHEIFIRIED